MRHGSQGLSLNAGDAGHAAGPNSFPQLKWC
jgi:hypothetical protein